MEGLTLELPIMVLAGDSRNSYSSIEQVILYKLIRKCKCIRVNLRLYVFGLLL